MPYKNDNLEELLKRAASDYPLKTDNSNWDSVASKLSPASVSTKGAKKSIWKYAALLVLFLGGGMLLYVNNFKSNNTQQKPIANTETSVKQNNISIQQNKIIDEHSGLKTNDITLNKNVAESVERKIENLKVAASKTTTDNAELQDNYSMLNQTKKDNNPALKNLNKNNLQENNAANTNVQSSLSFTNEKNNSSVINNNNSQAAPLSNNTLINKDNKTGITANQNINTPANNVNTATNTNSKAKNTLIRYTLPPSKLYGSLYGGVQLSTVKSQKIKDAGYKIGVALAYRVNSKFDVEIGLERQQINYFTSGENFNKSGLKLKDFTALQNVSGKSNLTSIPLTVKYNFKSNGFGNFYAGAGFNALVLTHTEDYDYTVSKNGDVDDRSKNYKSVTAPKYFTSLNTMIGYKHKLSNWCNFKVEPYYQVPISKLGVGKLPVTNFGVNIGIVKDLR